MIDKDELLFVVDENNNPLTPQPRSLVHAKGYWHRTSHIWILNSQNELLCQRRSLLKDVNPGFWEPFFGGHLAPNVDYLEGAILELNEELGLQIDKDQLKLFKIYKEQGKKASEFQGVFLLNWDGDISKIKFEKEEIDELKWFPLSEVRQFLAKNKDNWSEMGYEKEFFEWMLNN